MCAGADYCGPAYTLLKNKTGNGAEQVEIGFAVGLQFDLGRYLDLIPRGRLDTYRAFRGADYRDRSTGAEVELVGFCRDPF